MKQKEDKWEVSRSYVTGVIALVFLIIGYQTALFVHSAAVTRIAAQRDVRDTVYVSVKPDSGRPEHQTSQLVTVSQAGKTERPARAQAVRRNLPRSKVESFPFNPNTVSIEDLCRLGFSLKQAESIDNYRRKGGRFRRKSDFARSYVVSDSIYRRLESYITIPLTDLNLADSADFDALPGIGGWFASRIIEYRERLGGFSYKEQLMDIRNFDKERFDALSDLVTVSQTYVTPYPLWGLPADSLRRHPYIGEYSAKGIVLYRENNPKELWTVDGLIAAGIINPEYASRLLGCSILMP